ncbi:hypothetical protein GA829_27695 [Mesorhizobium sp. INR15]|nr:hypothetical protein GA829_27695 [Mesorhizobium sp. INR15]
MCKHVAAVFIIGLTIAPASARDTGLGGHVGGIGAGAAVSGSTNGISAGAGVSVGGVSVGTGVSAGQQGLSAGTGVNNGSVGGTTVGGSVSTGTASLGTSGNLGSKGVSTGIGNLSPAVTTAGSTPNNAAGSSSLQANELPTTLRPSKLNGGNSRLISDGYPFGPLAAFNTAPGTPPEVVSACRAAILSAAKPLGAVRVFAVSAGLLRQGQGLMIAPIHVRIDYAHKGAVQTRQAKISCTLDAAGTVTAVI